MSIGNACWPRNSCYPIARQSHLPNYPGYVTGFEIWSTPVVAVEYHPDLLTRLPV